MNKKTIGLIAAGAVLAIGLVIWHNHNACQPVDDESRALLQTTCIVDVKEEIQAGGREKFHNDLCKAAGKSDGCELSRETDIPAIDAWIQAKLQKCMDGKLKENNFCIDKNE